MNPSQLRRLGVPDHCLKEAQTGIRDAALAGMWKKAAGKELLRSILEQPANYLGDKYFAPLAQALTEDPEPVRDEPIDFAVWGRDWIEEESLRQMNDACRLPMATGAALMPDAHVGYGLPIGGVLALENAICPYAVGVDIACRMKMSILDLPVESLTDQESFPNYRDALEKGTQFGVGSKWRNRLDHPVLDRDWSITRVTRENKDKAWSQLGTSGSGNHFVEFGRLTLDEPLEDIPAGTYVALLSHSGSRGAGAAVCSTYSAIARQHLPKKYADIGRLAWLDMDSEAGQEYWAAMNLMGDYAAANHAVIHQQVTKLAGAQVLGGVENHHNFAWKETHGGREVYVHRMGATPAGKDVLGVIPGSMGSPAFVVRGKGNAASLDSASHGAGRVMSRKRAKDTFRFQNVRKELAQQGIRVLSAGSDEVPGVYKDIHQVMAEQRDLVEPIARFDPLIVKMCGDGSRPED